jgi:FtsP/CotA-like multicopper oxidase with cupredoxin domain
MQRRILFLSVLLVVAIAAIVDGAIHGQPGKTASAARRQGQVREFTLVAEPVKWEIQPGLVVDGWGYNGQIPGPTLRVTEGDLVRVHLINHLPAATTIHWHGIDVPTDMDGVPGLSQDAVDPGADFWYQFYATNPGTRWYHSHTDTDGQLQLGLYGAFIIDPAAGERVHYDREFTYILGERALDFTPAVAMGDADILHRDAGNGRGGLLQYDLFMMNGKAGSAIDPMDIAPGQRIRIRLINAGNLVHAMHLHGQSFKVIAVDGNAVPPAVQLVQDTVTIAPGERFDLEVNGTNPGVWLFHCHINNHAANGMSTVLQYDGYQPFDADAVHAAHGSSAPLPTGASNSEGSQVRSPIDTTAPATPTPAAPSSAQPPSATTTATGATASAANTSPAAGGSQIVMVDNHYAPAKITVTAGTTVTWMNNGTNLHTTTSLDGLWDSGTTEHGQTFSFTFDKPGTYRFYCRQHVLQGMSGTITVTGP